MTMILIISISLITITANIIRYNNTLLTYVYCLFYKIYSIKNPALPIYLPVFLFIFRLLVLPFISSVTVTIPYCLFSFWS